MVGAEVALAEAVAAGIEVRRVAEHALRVTRNNKDNIRIWSDIFFIGTTNANYHNRRGAPLRRASSILIQHLSTREWHP
jgi:hypothetical protein